MTGSSDAEQLPLSSASQRKDGSWLPLTGHLMRSRRRIDKSIAGLLTRGLIEERKARATRDVHRTDEDIAYDVFSSDKGDAPSLSRAVVADGDHLSGGDLQMDCSRSSTIS